MKMVFTISSKNIDITKSDEGRVWKPLFLSFIASLPFFTHGVGTTTLSSSPLSEHFVSTPDSVPWGATALLLGAIITTPLYCYIIDNFGRMVGIFIIYVVQGASCIPLFLALNEANTVILHTLIGVSSSGLFIVLPTYIREINTKQLRGLALSSMVLMTSTGYLMKLALNLEVTMFLLIGLVALQFVLMMFLLETPSYLVKVGKFEAATTNIAKLKCLAEDNPNVLNELVNLRDESDRAKSRGQLTIRNMWRNLIWRDGMKIGIVLYTVMVLCGSILFLDQQKALMQLRMTIDPEKSLVVLSMFAGSLFSVILVKFIERRYILTFAHSVMVLSMGILAVFTQADLTVRSLRWLPVVMLVVLIFGYGIAWGLPIIIMVEIFNLEIRVKFLGILFVYSQVIKLMHIHTFPYIEDYIGIYTIFYIFAAVNLYAAVYVLFRIPNIKDKSVRQIERQLKRVPLLKFNN